MRLGFLKHILLAAALTSALPSSPLAEEEGEILAPLFEAGDAAEYFIAESVEDTARWLDTFLGGAEAYEGNTGSLLQAGTKTTLHQYDGVTSESSVRARLVLPRTQERLNLVLQSDADETEDQKDLGLVGDYVPVEKVSGFGAALEGIIVETQQWKAAMRAGVQTKIPPDAFLRFDLRRRWYPGDARITVENKAYWYAVKGYANRFRVSLDKDLGDGFFMRPSAGTDWDENKDGYRWNAGSGFFVRMNPKDVISLDARASGQSSHEPVVDSYAVATELHHNVYKNWVFLGMGPGVTWTKDFDFNPALFFGVRFDLVFSKRLADASRAETLPPETPPISPSPTE